MSCNTIIKLPLYVQPRHVLYVIGKSIGVPFTYDVFNNFGNKKQEKPKFNSSLPADEDNPWHIDFDTSFEPEVYKVESVKFNLTDIASNRYQWLFNLEDEFEKHKTIYPNSSIFAVAIAKRLIDFFGGEAILNEYIDDSIYINNNPAYPERTEEQSSNDRWYQFYNALSNVQLLSCEELISAQTIASYDTDKDKNLFAYLEKLEFNKQLESSLDTNNSSIKKHKI